MKLMKLRKSLSKHKTRYFLIPLAVILIHCHCQTTSAQAPAKLRSTLSSGSSMKMISSTKKSFPIQQSIGQLSVIGTYEAKGYILRQGFVQPVYKKENTVSKTPEVKIAPNPFVANIKITLDNEITEKVNIAIVDLLGKVVYSNQFNAGGELNIDLSYLTRGMYIIKINTSKAEITSKLIKR